MENNTKNMDFNTLLTKLIYLTKRNNISNTEIGIAINVERRAMSGRAERNSKFKPDEIEQIENAFNVKLSDKTRVDCLTDTLAVEVDFANKWAECIGQAIYYGKMTNKQPACLLIMENGEKDLKYLKRLRRAAYRKGVNLRTFTIKPETLDN